MKRLLVPLLLLIISSPALAHDVVDEQTAISNSRRAIGTVLSDLAFVNTTGQPVQLADYRGRPLLLSLIYTACTNTCPLVVQNLYEAVEVAQETFGRDGFAVVTIGFDAANDTPQRLRSFARQQGVDLPNWDFLAGDRQTIDRLVEAVGFTIVPSAGGFTHVAQVSVVDANGRIYQQVYGDSFAVTAIMEPMKDLIYGRERSIQNVSDLVQRVKLFCTVYNPNTGRYEFDYSVFIGLAIGFACLLVVFLWLVSEYRRSTT